MRDLEELFTVLAQSKFRSRFRLHRREQRQLAEKSLPRILEQGRTLLSARLVPAEIPNDGKQTPLRGHPVFIAQHATATCCRRCLCKWHFIPQQQALDDTQLDYVLRVIELWLQAQPLEMSQPVQQRLFE